MKNIVEFNFVIPPLPSSALNLSPQVVCNSLVGFFLGGHDKDLYILCHSSEISTLNSLRDVKSGGCVMTVSVQAGGRILACCMRILICHALMHAVCHV